MHVQFDTVGTEVKRAPERGDSVLGTLAGRASVGDDFDGGQGVPRSAKGLSMHTIRAVSSMLTSGAARRRMYA
jgi:hypothetical protein